MAPRIPGFRKAVAEEHAGPLPASARWIGIRLPRRCDGRSRSRGLPQSLYSFSGVSLPLDDRVRKRGESNVRGYGGAGLRGRAPEWVASPRLWRSRPILSASLSWTVTHCPMRLPRASARRKRATHTGCSPRASGRWRNLFPGVRSDFKEAGAVILRVGRDVVWERPGYDPFPRRDLGSRRDLLIAPGDRARNQRTARERAERGNPLSRASCRSQSRHSIGRRSQGLPMRTIAARRMGWIAISLSMPPGRGVPTLAFLDRVGSPKPEQSEIGVDVGYASAIFEPSDQPRDWMGFGASWEASRRGARRIHLPYRRRPLVGFTGALPERRDAQRH